MEIVTNVLYETDFIECSDWTNRHLGNENVDKNVDSYFIYPQKYHNDLFISTGISIMVTDTVDYYIIDKRCYACIKEDVGKIKICTSTIGLIYYDSGGLRLDIVSQDWLYKIQIVKKPVWFVRSY